MKNKNILIYVLIGIILFLSIYVLTSKNKDTPKMIYPSSDHLSDNSSQTPVSVKPSGNTYDYTEAKNHEGEMANVIGTVFQVFTSKSNTTFFDFCLDYKGCGFSAVIFSSDLPKFKNITEYEGKEVTINGLIKDYQGNAEIIISNPNQIKIN